MTTPARPMIFGSVCSGIESASVAWKPLGWRCAFMADIDPFPRAVLAHRFPEVPLHGDFTTIAAGDYAAIDLLVGGTPCQDFSVAGKRAGLDGARGNLTLEYLRLADRLRPRWIVWENVPGVLSSNGGRDFGAFLGALGECGYGFAYRVLDAQFVRVDGHPRAVPQRRQRVFVVGHLGDWRPSAAALLEPESLRGDPAPRREARKADPRAAAFCSGGGRQSGGVDVAASLAAHGHRLDGEVETFVAEPIAPTLPARRSSGGGFGTDFDCDGGLIASTIAFDTTHLTSPGNYSNPQPGDPCHPLTASGHVPAVAFSIRGREGGAMPEIEPGGACPALRAANGGSSRPMVAFAQNQRDEVRLMDVAGALASEPGMKQQTYVHDHYTVRRLSVTECERLMGFPDGWTQVPYRGKPAADGPRYKALGNSKAVNVVRWVGQRIAMVDAILKEMAA